jgi:hypothetical protein
VRHPHCVDKITNTKPICQKAVPNTSILIVQQLEEVQTAYLDLCFPSTYGYHACGVQPPQRNSHELTFMACFMPTPQYGKIEQNSAISSRTSGVGTIRFTTVTTTQNRKSLPFCCRARTLPLVSIHLHLMLFENVLNVNQISSVITDTLYIALKQETVQREGGQYRGRNM